MLLVVSSCAYRLRRGSLSKGVGDVENARVFVPIIDNMTAEVGPEAVLTGAVREAMSTLRGIEVVNEEQRARFMLLGRVREWGRRSAAASRSATVVEQDRGGLIEKQTTAADIRVFLVVEFELSEIIPSGTSQTSVKRNLWKRQFKSDASFDAYAYHDELAGSSSAPHINRSREDLQLRQMADGIARQIIDQVSQDF